MRVGGWVVEQGICVPVYNGDCPHCVTGTRISDSGCCCCCRCLCTGGFTGKNFPLTYFIITFFYFQFFFIFIYAGTHRINMLHNPWNTHIRVIFFILKKSYLYTPVNNYLFFHTENSTIQRFYFNANHPHVHVLHPRHNVFIYHTFIHLFICTYIP